MRVRVNLMLRNTIPHPFLLCAELDNMDVSFQRVVEWKRRFLYESKYTSVEQLLDDAENGGPASEYVTMALNLLATASR